MSNNNDNDDDILIPASNCFDHATPIYQEHQDGDPSHYEIPNEDGYFPAPSTHVVASCPATLYQIHPDYNKNEESSSEQEPLARGTLRLSDPDDGTATEVALIGECNDVLFLVEATDATTRISDTEFLLLLPHDCILVQVDESVDPETILHLEAIFAARTQFHDETKSVEETNKKQQYPDAYPNVLPDDKISHGLYRTSKLVSNLLVATSGKAAQGIEKYGQHKRNSIQVTKEKNVSETSIKVAKATRRVSDTTLRVSTKVSDKISSVIGGGVGRAVAIKEGDSSTKKGARRFLLASTIAFDEVASGATEGYETVVKAAKSQSIAYVSTKYGENAAELARHSAGSAANFGRTALTARRIINVKKIAKSAGKNAVKTAVKQSILKK